MNNICRDNQKRPESIAKPCVDWIYGATGTGKSFGARKECDDGGFEYYVKAANNKWWCGYKGEPYVIIEDVDVDHKYMAFHFKIWFDRYAFNAEIKNSSRWIRPVKIIVTSNYHPSEIWKNSSDLNPKLRRCKVIRMCKIGLRTDDKKDDEIRMSSYADNFVAPSNHQSVMVDRDLQPSPINWDVDDGISQSSINLDFLLSQK